ncbi:MAG: A/G-specific adenine glycosylase [Candidatus Gracilibacteria bacterium]|jgi:A/G-specific adenine glycosylase
MNFSTEERAEISKGLLRWFATHQRPLPWRKHYAPYEVWISEIMLQQTQVATMLPYFNRWMKALPSIKAVAQAREEDLIKLWEGLGYYSRVKNIHKAARILVEKNEGRFFEKYEDIVKLPGIGPYTAAAICSIAFEQDFPVVDGNVVRVLSRLGDFREDVRYFKKAFWEEAGRFLPKGQARAFNQALMEFGALQCTPKSPACSKCPLQSLCKAAASGTQEFLPNKGPSSSKIPIQVVIAVITKNGKVFVQKRRDTGLMAGLWEFPGGQVENGETLEEALHREIEEELAIRVKNLRFFMNIKHAYTKYTVDLHCFLADFDSGTVNLNAASESRWLKPEQLSQLAFPAANVKLIHKLLSFRK